MKSVIIGFGVIGRVHAEVLKNQGAEIAAVCDTDSSKLSGFGCRSYCDYIDMIESEKPDVVHICTPHYLHADMSVECLKRGINVLCEKPMCISEDDVCRISEAALHSSAQFGLVLQNRYNAANLFVKKYTEINPVIDGFGIVNWQRDRKYYASASWRGKKSTEGGGVLINQALHTLDLMQWFIGMPSEVTANTCNFMLKDIIEVEDSAMAVFSGDRKFSFFATNTGSTDFPVEITLKTDKDYIKILPDAVMLNGELIDFKKDNRILGKRCYGTGHEDLIADFYDCIKCGRKFPIDAGEGGKVMKLIFGIYKSKGETVKL